CAPARPAAGCLGSRRRRGAPRTVAPPTIARVQALSPPAGAGPRLGATPEAGFARLRPSWNALSFVLSRRGREWSALGAPGKRRQRGSGRCVSPDPRDIG